MYIYSAQCAADRRNISEVGIRHRSQVNTFIKLQQYQNTMHFLPFDYSRTLLHRIIIFSAEGSVGRGYPTSEIRIKYLIGMYVQIILGYLILIRRWELPIEIESIEI
jgi:hypothetical protein